MDTKRTRDSGGPESTGISRRNLLAGAASAALIASTPLALAAKFPKQRPRSHRIETMDAPLRRYMASSALLLDGRVITAGGYDRQWSGGAMPSALTSVVIYDPDLDKWFEAAPMKVARARHAMATLSDGRIAVMGGISKNPTASVEIYDPTTDTWDFGESLAQPRYDHSAVATGDALFVFGGSGHSMISGVELLSARTSTEFEVPTQEER